MTKIPDFQNLASNAEKAERFLKAMANGHRLMILCELHKGEISVTPLQEAIGLSQSSLSQHLARLREDSLVKTRRESQTIYYSLADTNVSRMIELLYDLFCSADCANSGDTEPNKSSIATGDKGHGSTRTSSPKSGKKTGASSAT